VTDHLTQHPDTLRTRSVPVRRTAGLLALGALGIAALGLLAWRQMAADDAAVLAGLHAAHPRATASTPARGGSPAAPAPRQAPTPAAAEALPLQAQLARLLATGDPRDAYRAYWLVADCAAFNANGDRVVFDHDEMQHPKGDGLPGFRGMTEDEKRHDAGLCAGMSERERLNRLDYLAVAARAGVPGAAVDFAAEGPFGDKSALTTRPDDPLVKEWKETARAQLSRAAESGVDQTALQFWASDNLNGSDFNDRDPALAYRYMLAYGLIALDTYGAGNPISTLYAVDGGFLRKVGAELTPEQRAAELAAAQAIAQRARAARKAGRGG
jgi:hypothetical protein